MNPLDPSFARAIILKTSFHPEPLRRCQAAILYTALSYETFTADDALPGELTNGDTKISGISFGSLASMKLITWVDRAKSRAESRNGAFTNVWTLGDGKKATVLTWLERNQFPLPKPQQQEFAI